MVPVLKLQELEAVDRRLALVDELRQAERRASISRVASVIAHLIGTPLNVITGRAALIRANPSREATLENARRIEEQVERLALRIRRLIDYLTIPEAETRPVAADLIVRDALGLYAPIAAERGVTIDVVTSPITDAQVDGTSALVVLTSLLSLALRIAPKGTRVELAVEPVASSGASFELCIPGFCPPSARIDRLDPPEDMADAELLQVLSVCFAIARRHGGRVDVVTRDDGKAAIRFECCAL
jgi:signal transduction histidine kinase